MSTQTQNGESPEASGAIFLTPRVVDRGAFEAFASMLRASVEKAERESDLLARRAEAAASVLERLEGFVGSHADIFQRAGTLIDSIDQRQRSAGETLESLTKRSEQAQQAAREVEALVRERTEALEGRLGAVTASAVDGFESVRRSLASDASTMRRELSQRLEELRQRGESLIAGLEERAEGASGALAERLALVESGREAMRAEQRETARRLGELGEELREGLRGESAALRRELESAARALREAVAAGSAHRDTIERAAELAIARVQAGAGERAQEIEKLSRRAEAVLRAHRESADAVSAELAARLETAQERADAASAAVVTRTREGLAEIEARASETLRGAHSAVESASEVSGNLDHREAEASALAERLAGLGEDLESRLATMVERAAADQIAAVHTEAESVRERLSVAERERASLREIATSQSGQIAALEKLVAELIAARAEAESPADVREAPAEEPEAPEVVVVTKPARKRAPARKKPPMSEASGEPAVSNPETAAASDNPAKKSPAKRTRGKKAAEPSAG